MKENQKINIKNKYLIISIFIVVVLLIGGTISWFTWRSKKSSLVLTVGSPSDIMVTLFPYETNLDVAPVVTYQSSNFVSVTVKNNGSDSGPFSILYNIEDADTDLLECEDMKYTVEKSTDNGNTYTVVATKNFTSYLSGDTIEIMDDIPANSTYYYKIYTYLESNGDQTELEGKSFNFNVSATLSADSSFESIEFDYTGDMQEFVVPLTGNYKIEAWGAQGGSYNAANYGGYGGYSVGNIELHRGDTLYVYVGGTGSCGSGSTNKPGGYNGGGNAPKAGTDHYTCSGGGATHIASVLGLLSELSESTDSIYIVAGGGGGAYYHTAGSTHHGAGGAGGGIEGGNGKGTNYAGTGGTQTAAGCGGGNNCGGFGYGGSITTTNHHGSAGGGGYYGGGASKATSGTANSSGGGGSGYIGNPLLINKFMYCYNCTTSNDAVTKTFSTTNFSSNPIATYAKTGNGYAKISLVE